MQDKDLKFYARFFDELSSVQVYEILKARQTIFTVEQKILYVDADDVDYESLHCFFLEDKKVEAYLRAFYVTKNGEKLVKIGRVLTLKHGSGLGKMLMEKSILAIKERFSCKKICMDAQKHAEGFYKKLGFRTVSDEYLEEGIVHVDMELDLGN